MANFPGIRVLNSSDDYRPQSGIQFNTPAQTAQVNADLAGQAIQQVGQATQANRQVTRAATDLLAGAQPGVAVRPGQDFTGLKELSVGLMTYFKEREEKRRQQAGVDFLQEASDLATKIPEELNERGQLLIRRDINDIVDRYQADGVPLEVLARGLQGMSMPLDSALEAKMQAQAKAAAELAAAERERQLATESYKIAGTLGALSVPGITSDRQTELMNSLVAELQASMGMLDPIAANQLANQVYTTLGQSSAASSKLREEVQSRVALSADYYNRASVLYSNFQSGAIDYAEYSTQLSQLAANYPNDIPAAFNFSQLPQQVQALAQQTLSLQQSAEALQDRQLEGYDVDAITLDNSKFVVSYLTQHVGMIDQFEATIKATTGGTVPAELVGVVSAAREYQRYTNEQEPQLWEAYTAKRSEVTNLASADVRDYISMYRRMAAMSSDPSAVPSSIAQIRDQLLMQTGMTPEQFVTMPPEKIAELQEIYDSSRTQAVADIQAEANAAYDRYLAAGRRFSMSGLLQRDATTGRYTQVPPPQESPLPGIVQELSTAAARLRAMPVGHGGLPPNFSVPQLHTQVDAGGNKLIFPLRPQDTIFEFSSGQVYNAPRPGRLHQGLDFGVPMGTEVVSYVSGEVVDVRPRGDYGNTVKIRADDGTYHFFAHLDSATVSPGTRVSPGEVIALSGDTGTGGPHLHWEVTTEPESGHIDPLEYARQIPQRLRQWRGSGGNPVSYNGTIPLDNGTYITSDTNAVAEASRGAVAASEYSVRNPVRHRFASSRASDYLAEQEPTHNYGYQALTRPEISRALYNASRATNVPAQWIADLVAVETDNSWSTSAYNRSSGATGLIQFIPSTAQWLGTSTEELRNMSVPQQMHYVAEYIKRVQDYAGPITSPEELVVGVLHGMGALREFKQDPDRYDWNSNHAGLSLTQYMNKLGIYTGRSYNHRRRRVSTHVSYTPGCAVCEQSAFGGFSVPHEAVG